MTGKEVAHIENEWKMYRGLLADKLISGEIDATKYRLFLDKLAEWGKTFDDRFFGGEAPSE